MSIGVISDTHDYLDPKVAELFKGVNHILHAGDIGLPWLVLQLEEIAPVTAVLGNTDAFSQFKETELVQLEGKKFLVHHVVDVRAPSDPIKRRIVREDPDVVVFGHTHKPFCQTFGRTLYLNPGYAGRQRFDLPRTVAILHCEASGFRAEFKEL
jgi:hypothetical protein